MDEPIDKDRISSGSSEKGPGKGELTWLHISDLHLCPKLTGWDETAVLGHLVRDLKRLEKEKSLKPDMIFVTGDIMYGARKECGNTSNQYESAHLFLLEVLNTCNVAVENLFLVPGNHDVKTFKMLDSQADWLCKRQIGQIEDFLQSAKTEWPGIVKRLDDYGRFLKDLDADHLLADHKRLIYAEKRTIHGISVGIAGFNTAWSSCGKGASEKGHLWFGGKWQINTLFPQIKDCDIRIGLSHHPCNWFNPSEDPDINPLLEERFHFHLHGHEHRGWIEFNEDAKHCRVAAGAVYVRSEKEEQAGYNFGRLDFEKGEGEIWFRFFDDTGSDGWITKEISGKTDSAGCRKFPLAKLVDVSPSPPVKPPVSKPEPPPRPENERLHFFGHYGTQADAETGKGTPGGTVHRFGKSAWRLHSDLRQLQENPGR